MEGEAHEEKSPKMIYIYIYKDGQGKYSCVFSQTLLKSRFLSCKVPVAFALRLPDDCTFKGDFQLDPAIGTVPAHGCVDIRVDFVPSIHQM